MGLFSGITDLFSGGVGTAISGALGFLGQQDTNSANAQLSKESMEWQERMRDTQYQSAVKDLQAAGLNPMLAYSKGGNQTPSAPNVAKMENAAGAGANSAMAAATTANVTADTENKRAQAEQIKAQTQLLRAQTENTATSTTNIGAQTDQIRTTINKAEHEIQLIKEKTNLTGQQAMTESERMQLTQAQTTLATIQQELEQKKITNIEAQTRLTNLASKLKDLEIPGAENEAGFQESIGELGRWGKAAGAAGSRIGSILNSARKALK